MSADMLLKPRIHARRLPPAGFFFLAVVLTLTGCATPPLTQKLVREGPAGLPPARELASVPFFPQENHQCGPAALATALAASGAPVTPEALVPEVYLPDREGSLQVEMLAAARRHGRVAVPLRPELRDVLEEVAAGNPVVVLQNLALSWYPRWHYAVVVGYDLARNEVVLRSGRNKREVMTFSTFEYTWARGSHWSMLVLPPSRLPAAVPEETYLEAVVALEKTGQTKAAREAYRAASRRWSSSLLALIGLGNTAYALGDLAGAEQAFRRAVSTHPRSDAALNNLAQVLADRGKAAEAAATVRRAIAVNGPNMEAAQQTLRSMAAPRQEKRKSESP